MIAAYRDNANAAIAWWEELDRWVNPEHILSFPHLPSTWKEAAVGEVVAPVTERCRVNLGRPYNLMGVKWYGDGVFHREKVEGTSLSSTYLTPATPRAFI